MENQNNNIIGNIDSIYNNGNIVLKSASSIFYNSFYFQDYYDDALTKKFIKSTESLIRRSAEYNDYLALIKTNYNILNYDNIQSNIGASDASIEFHHYPCTLYEIVETVMGYHIAKGDTFTSFSIAKEVMELHFAHKIGFVPLSKTNHELAHDNSMFISTKQVFGRWKEFINTYKDGASADLLNKIERIEKLSDKAVASDFKGIY